MERVIRVLKATLAKLSDSVEHANWRQKLTHFEYAMNNTNNSSTGESPSKLLFGVEQRGVYVDELTEYLSVKRTDESVDLGTIRNDASDLMERSQQYNSQYFASKCPGRRI